MKKMLGIAVVFFGLFFLGGCETTTMQNSNPKTETIPLPQNRDDAAHFLAKSQQAKWELLYQLSDGGDVYIYPDHVVRYADGIHDVWLKIQFYYALPTPLSPEPIVATLMHTQVQCAQGTYRTDAWYAISQAGEIVDTVDDPYSDFRPLGTDPAADKIFNLACRKSIN